MSLDVRPLLRLHEQMQNIEPQKPVENAPSTRPDQTVIITRGVVRLFRDLGLAALTEFKLANGRRVDVAGLDRRGRLVFAEVKSCRADFDTDQKWPDYLEYCDQFFFAVDLEFPRALLPTDEGLILADGFGAAIDRDPIDRQMAAARRKAVTLRFARQAATRLVHAEINSQ